MPSSNATVIYLNKPLYQKVKQAADQKFDKPSYVKSLWTSREYKKRGGKVKYEGGKPSNESIKKAVASQEIEQDGCFVTASLLWNDYETEEVIASLDQHFQPLDGEQDNEVLFAARFWDDNKEEISADDESHLAELERFDSFDAEEYLALAANEGKTLNKPFRTPSGPKKFSVFVKNKKGNVVKINFGDPLSSIKRDDPERKKSFRARHKCDQQKDKTTPAYWSCKMWSNKPVSKITADKLLEINPSLANAIEEIEES
jgi:hypothetical protein